MRRPSVRSVRRALSFMLDCAKDMEKTYIEGSEESYEAFMEDLAQAKQVMKLFRGLHPGIVLQLELLTTPAPWCPACKSYHAVPLDQKMHKTLACVAPFKPLVAKKKGKK